MNTIQEIKKFPIGSTIPAVYGTVKIVWERELKKGQYGEFFSQGFVLADGDEEIVVSCMDFDDLKYLKGQTVSVAATGKDKRTGLPTGTKLKEYNGKLSIGVSKKSGGFVGGDTPNPAHMAGGTPLAAPQTAIPANSSHSATPSRGIEGVTVGMAVNCAVRLAAANGVNTDDLDAYIYARASALIRTAQRLQAGDLAP